MSEVEHFEHAEHAALLGDPFLTQVAVTIAILAVIAATVGSLETLETADAIGDKNAAVLLQNKATDTWNFYQAKSIKKNLYAIAAANGGPKAGDFKKQAERYGEDEQELFAKGQALEHQTEEKLRDSERHEDRHHILTVAGLPFQFKPDGELHPARLLYPILWARRSSMSSPCVAKGSGTGFVAR